MKFETILGLTGKPSNYEIAKKDIIVLDGKGRNLYSIDLCSNYRLTEHSAVKLEKFCEGANYQDIQFLIIRLFENAICIFDSRGCFKLILERAS